MPTLRVELFTGRTDEQKRDLVKKLTEACVAALGTKPEGVDVLLFEIEKTHWATGGVLWSDKK